MSVLREKHRKQLDLALRINEVIFGSDPATSNQLAAALLRVWKGDPAGGMDDLLKLWSDGADTRQLSGGGNRQTAPNHKMGFFEGEEGERDLIHMLTNCSVMPSFYDDPAGHRQAENSQGQQTQARSLEEMEDDEFVSMLTNLPRFSF